MSSRDSHELVFPKEEKETLFFCKVGKKAVQLLPATSGDSTPQLNSSEKNGGAKMMKTVVGVFNDFTAAANALPDFVHEGIPRDHISIVTPDTEGEFAQYLSTRAERPITEDAGVGTIIGGLSGLLIGLGALTIPWGGTCISGWPFVHCAG